MKGYKGLEVKNGIIRGSQRYIFELGIPSIQVLHDRNKTDFQDCYFHYCANIEDVLNWRNFLSEYKIGMKDFRLFEIEAEDDYFMNYNIDWVTNKITIIREIEQNEIIEYFDKSQDKIKKASEILKNESINFEEIFEKFKHIEREPFQMILDDDEVINRYIKTCIRYKEEYCLQKDEINLKIDRCEKCNFYRCLGSMETYIVDCYYEIVRNAISRGEDISKNIYYKFLLERKSSCELEAIERLRSHHR